MSKTILIISGILCALLMVAALISGFINIKPHEPIKINGIQPRIEELLNKKGMDEKIGLITSGRFKKNAPDSLIVMTKETAMFYLIDKPLDSNPDIIPLPIALDEWEFDANITSLQSCDIDSDAVDEVVITSKIYGTGCGVELVRICSLQNDNIAILTTAVDINGTRGYIPEINYEGSANFSTQKLVLFKKWLNNNFLNKFISDEQVAKDPDNSEYAEIMWVKDNGGFIADGNARHRSYPGKFDPKGWTTEDILTVNDLTFYAMFKGGVYCYDKVKDHWFVVYTPHNLYIWASALCSNGHFVWIGTRGDGIIRYNIKNSVLAHFTQYGNVIEDMKIIGDHILIDTLTDKKTYKLVELSK